MGKLKLSLQLAILVALTVSIMVAANRGIIPPTIELRIVFSVIALLGGIWMAGTIATMAFAYLRPRINERAYAIANFIKVAGFIGSGVAAISIAGVGFEAALTGGIFSGLVVGLASQQMLSNLFAGLMILFTKMVEPGSEVRLITWQLPYQWAFLPGYKYFSPDYIMPGYRGTIKEVGLFYSTMISDNGLTIRIPNSVILGSAVADYSAPVGGERRYKVRYEFNVRFDPELTLSRVRESLRDIPNIRSVFINEQSDKENYIVVVEFEAPYPSKWREIKSEILKKLIKLHAKLLQEVPALAEAR